MTDATPLFMALRIAVAHWTMRVIGRKGRTGRSRDVHPPRQAGIGDLHEVHHRCRAGTPSLASNSYCPVTFTKVDVITRGILAVPDACVTIGIDRGMLGEVALAEVQR